MPAIRLTALLLISAAWAPLEAQSCPAGPTALVLSGGGVKGLAHIGVLRALDQLGATPDLIVGTSMGAIVGGLYASGYAANQIDSLLRDLPISEVVRPFRPPAPHPWNRRIPLVFLVKGRHGFTFQTGVIDEAQPNARLNAAMLQGNLVARGRFDDLPIPFRAVATDLRDRRTVVLDTGDLAKAVRASSAIPLVFPPVVAGNAVLVDGGLSANIPVTEARLAGAARVIVSDVTEYPRDTLDVESPLALADQLLGFLFQQRQAERREGDIWVRPNVQRFRSLDFSPASVAEILLEGQRAADSTVGRDRCLPHRTRATPVTPRTLTAWRVTSGSSLDSVLLDRHLRLGSGVPLDVDELRQGLVALAEAEALRGVWLNPAGTGDAVSLNLEPLTAPRTVGGLGVAYDHDLGGRAWAGWFDHRVLGTTGEASLLLSLGKFQRELAATALAHLDAGSSRITPVASAHLRSEDVRRFDGDGVQQATAPTRDGQLALGVEFRPHDRLRLRLSATALRYQDPDRTIGAVGTSFEGGYRSGTGVTASGDAVWAGPVARVRGNLDAKITAGGWDALASARFGWGRHLPLQWTMPLGGDTGFPGLHLGARRGSTEVMAALRIGRRFVGPLEARGYLAAGRTSPTGAQAWIGGARLGVGADTPVGAMDLAVGTNTARRTALYLRLGQWF